MLLVAVADLHTLLLSVRLKMPQQCSAKGCKSRRTLESRLEGTTFHKFPNNPELRQRWEVAIRREGFTSSSSSVLCSKHFTEEDIDRTGQIIRLRDGVVPSVFNLPSHRKQDPTKAKSTKRFANVGKVTGTDPRTDKTAAQTSGKEPDPYMAPEPKKPRSTKTSANAGKIVTVLPTNQISGKEPDPNIKPEPQKSSSTETSANAGKIITVLRTSQTSGKEPDSIIAPQDHCYAASSMSELKNKLTSAQNRIQDLERQLRNAKDRERRSRKTIKNMLAELRLKNLVNQELELELDQYMDMHCNCVTVRKGEQPHSEAQRELDVTL